MHIHIQKYELVAGLLLGLVLAACRSGTTEETTAEPEEAAEEEMAEEEVMIEGESNPPIPTVTTRPPIATLPPEELQTVAQFALEGVSTNADWTPYIQEFDGMRMALVPAGCFMMGSKNGESDEQPIHQVCFDQPFWIDVYEVTSEAFYSADSGRIRSAHPVNYVSWSLSLAYCESRGARLPTEAEWEYAARGPDALVYPWGNGFKHKNVVYDDTDPAPVGSKEGGRSWVGAYDLSGNVWEWVNDWYDPGYYASSPASNPQGPDSGERRVVRGGSWFNSSDNVRAAYRGRSSPDNRRDNIGFRCARSYDTETVPEGFPTPEPVPTPVPTATLPPQELQIVVEFALEGVSTNTDWIPYIQEFDGVPMALVPAGCLMMGSENGESDELPVHDVCFDEPFWIDVYEVTNEQYGRAGEPCTNWSSGWSPESDQPHICIDWFDSVAHCESRGARLPTEAEWEYAARGPDALVYPWGNDFIQKYVVYEENSALHPRDVGSQPDGMSWVGAYDLSGNVWEWVNDWYDSGYYASSPVSNPQGPDSGDYRVLRGGSWINHSGNVRSANRGWSSPDNRWDDSGFRCVRSY